MLLSLWGWKNLAHTKWPRALLPGYWLLHPKINC